MKTSPDFDFIVMKQFKFIESEFGFRFLKAFKEEWGCELTYLNDTTGVKITYESRDGSLVENPAKIHRDTTLYGYDLDDIIGLRNAAALIKPAYEYGEESGYFDSESGLSRYVASFARNLREYGSDVLSGDFGIFKQVDKIVKDRADQHT